MTPSDKGALSTLALSDTLMPVRISLRISEACKSESGQEWYLLRCSKSESGQEWYLLRCSKSESGQEWYLLRCSKSESGQEWKRMSEKCVSPSYEEARTQDDEMRLFRQPSF